MSQELTHYELDIDHPLTINGVPASQFAALEQEWKSVPIWRQLIAPPQRFRPLRAKGPAQVTADTQHVGGAYESLESALAAAEKITDEMGSEIHPWTCVCVVAVSGMNRKVVDGVYPFGGGRI